MCNQKLKTLYAWGQHRYACTIMQKVVVRSKYWTAKQLCNLNFDNNNTRHLQIYQINTRRFVIYFTTLEDSGVAVWFGIRVNGWSPVKLAAAMIGGLARICIDWAEVWGPTPRDTAGRVMYCCGICAPKSYRTVQVGISIKLAILAKHHELSYAGHTAIGIGVVISSSTLKRI